MKTTLNWIFACSLLMANGLASCASIPTVTLYAGLPFVPPQKLAQSKDGPALMARFTAIEDLDIDQEDNVYVVDKNVQENGNSFSYTLIRKISPNGQVTTFGGKNPNSDSKALYSLPLLNKIEIEIINNSLYFSNLGCLIRFNINESNREAHFNEVMGKCISAEDAEHAFLDPSFLPETKRIFDSFYSNGDSVLYFRDYNSSNIAGRSSEITNYSLNNKLEIQKLPHFFDATYKGVDSKGYLYRNQEGSPGPGSGGPSSILKYDVEGSRDTPPILGYQQLKSPQLFTIDRKDNLYVIDDNLIKRLTSTGKLEVLAQAPQSKIKLMRVNPESTTLYLTDVTGLYKLPLSPITN